MKFVDKNGYEIDCTPAEYIELNNLSQRKKTISNSPIKRKRKSKRRVNWRERINEVENLLNSGKKSFSIAGISVALGYGQGSSASLLRKKLMKNKNIKKNTKGTRIKFSSLEYKESSKLIPKIKYKNPIKSVDKRVERFQFMNARCKYLQNTQFISREKAMVIANDEWKAKGKIVKVKQVEDKFPALYGVPIEAEQLVIDTIRNCIANHIKIGYFDLKEKCNWESGRTWVFFITSFIKSSQEISDYFSVPNLFSKEVRKGYDYLVYGDTCV